MTHFIEDKFAKVNQLFKMGKIKEFWRRGRKPRKDIPSILTARDLAAHYECVMTEQGQLTPDQSAIAHQVKRLAQRLQGTRQPCRVSVQAVAHRVTKLKPGCAPGIDTVSADLQHLKHGNSLPLCQILADLFPCCFSWRIVPTSFTLGVIVPILKKPASNPNDANSYTGGGR
jgi:hypothetical protein